MALAPAAGLRPRQLALAAGLDHAERLLVEVDRAPAQREQLAAAQAGERGGDVEARSLGTFSSRCPSRVTTPAISRKLRATERGVPEAAE